MDLDKLIKAVEQKTVEEIVDVTIQKTNVLANFLCKLGFHKWYVKSGEGHFCKNQCFNCGKYGLPPN
ncbi:hypothetical protein [Flavobacterium sp. WC2509]|uniref:hypothetical protein n=1 Tax=Flavobacterium sp. WC2509 TaxID=3461406 RepID=UPI0040445721